MFRCLLIIMIFVSIQKSTTEARAADIAPDLLDQTDSSNFYSGSWRSLDIDKQWIIKGLSQQRLIKIECEGASNDEEFPSYLILTDGTEYRWPINESGAAFLDLGTLALREAGAGEVVNCSWSAIGGTATKSEAVQIDVLPGHDILLGGFSEPREFSIEFEEPTDCTSLSAQLYIDGNPLLTLDNVQQNLTPRATFFGLGETIEAKISGVCPSDSTPAIKFVIAQ